MSIINKLSFGFSQKVPVILQTEASECGLACLAMIANFHGYKTDLATLRRRFSVSLKGTNLSTLVKIANKLNLITRPVRLEIDDLDKLSMPCILHWDFSHFVVLLEVTRDSIVIIDPVFGRRQLHIQQVSKSFTGVALEAWPDTNFEKKEEKRKVELWSLMGKIRSMWSTFGQILILAVALEVFTLVAPFFLQWVIDHVIISANKDLLLTLVLGFGLLMIFQQCIGLLRSWVMMFVSTSFKVQGRANIFNHLMHLPVQYFERRHLGDVISRFQSIDIIQKTLTTTFLEAILDGLMTVFTLFLMFIYSPKLGGVAVATMVLYVLIRWLWYRPLRSATEEEIVYAAKQNTHLIETLRGIKTIKIFQKQDSRRSSWMALFIDQVNAGLVTQKLGLLVKFANGLLFGIENILIIWIGTLLVLNSEFSIGALIAFMAYKTMFDTRVSALIDKYVEVKMLELEGERLADIAYSTREQNDSDVFISDKNLMDASIEVCNLKFRYSEHDPIILKDISFKVSAGESIAIIGSTGCGKSTLLNILLGVLPITDGDVKIGGQSIKEFGVGFLRQMVGTVLQDDVLFAGSIEENISFFDVNPDMDWIVECTKMAAVHSDILAMPMGYKTLVGDMGTVLSGGQRQRVLLARALYKKPKLLFLDEATSNLDVDTELLVNQHIKKLSITRIMIAHRPETIRAADRVLKLSNGTVIDDFNISDFADPN
ncbi:peptidase domain-containing ABC transporter [Acinetobacter baumannii]|uniref:Peptidase domain-containing ABC transporter n=2 Tax=Acinetobacter calcoaceticus/baumannii complex TaxID=909768 RepID=A0AA90KAN8_ACIBA|nr:peptidase domain-containing ABC transporter [Acinetobacter baumannii]MEC5497927.1 peptidase domain-containing ABC transporter [Acinetobacter baumannii]